MKKLHGVTVAMVTPMDSRGAFLKEAMEQLTEALIARGAGLPVSLRNYGRNVPSEL